MSTILFTASAPSNGRRRPRATAVQTSADTASTADILSLRRHPIAMFNDLVRHMLDLPPLTNRGFSAYDTI